MIKEMFAQVSQAIQRKQWNEALRFCDMALAANRLDVDAYHFLGFIACEQGLLDEAIQWYEKALLIAPEHAFIYQNLCNAYIAKKQYAKAIAHVQTLMAMGQDKIECIKIVAKLRNMSCDWSHRAEDIALLKKELQQAIQENRHTAVSPHTVFILFPEPELLLQAAQRWSTEIVRKIQQERAACQFAFSQQQKKRIKIGYLSCNFGDFALSCLLHRVLYYHDKAQFEIYIYSYRPNVTGTMYKQIQAVADHFVDVSGESDVEAATRIHQDGIDILVDLKGYAGEINRVNIQALRPAPVQISYLESLATSGSDFIDYIVADKYVIPDDQQRYYSEKILYMPDTFQANDDQPDIADVRPSRAEVSLPEQAIVYCAFHQPFKIEPTIFATWMRILAAVPNSVLWLLQEYPACIPNLQQAAVAAGIDPARLIFAPALPKPQHLARLALADVYLDSTHINAGATASDALYMGVPMITCPGDTYATRIGLSVLNAIGMPELVTSNLAEYEALAIALGVQPAKLAQLKTTLAKNSKTHPLFNTKHYTQQLEKLFLLAWNNYVAGKPPTHFAL